MRLPGATQASESLSRWGIQLRSIISGLAPQPATEPRPLSALALVTAIVLTLFWQTTFAYAAPKLDLTYRITATAGLFGQSRFYYFYYYLGLFPLSADGVEPVFSKEGAESIIRDHPQALRMEKGYEIRSGDLGKVWLYSLGAFLKGSPKDLSTIEFNSWFFTLGLIGILTATWYSDRFILGIFLVALLGSHPFQLYEVYGDPGHGTGQVFAVTISTALWVLAFHIPLLFDRKLPKVYVWLLPLGTGLFLATVRQIRTEPTVMILSAVACYMLANNLDWRTKAALSLLLLAAFGITSWGWDSYWDSKFNQTYQVVQSAGGRPYTGPRDRYHSLWQAVWCGLGDFDRRYGYKWDDVAAFNYATPILKQAGVLDFDMIGTEASTAWYDDAQTYYKVIWTIPRYQELLRNKVIGDILRDPLWYLEILAKRIWRVLTDVVPARLSLGANWVALPLGGLLIVPTIVLLILLRRWRCVKLLVFTLPLTATALIIYSGGGYTHYSIYLQVLAAIYGAALFSSLALICRFAKKALAANRRMS